MAEREVATLVPDDEQGWRLTCTEQARVAESNAYLGYLADRSYSPRTIRAYGYGLDPLLISTLIRLPHGRSRRQDCTGANAPTSALRAVPVAELCRSALMSPVTLRVSFGALASLRVREVRPTGRTRGGGGISRGPVG